MIAINGNSDVLNIEPLSDWRSEMIVYIQKTYENSKYSTSHFPFKSTAENVFFISLTFSTSSQKFSAT